MAYSRRSGSLPGGSVDDPGDPPIAEGIGCSADIQQVLCGRGRGRASVMEIQILVTARAQHGRTLQKNGCFFFFKIMFRRFFKNNKRPICKHILDGSNTLKHHSYWVCRWRVAQIYRLAKPKIASGPPWDYLGRRACFRKNHPVVRRGAVRSYGWSYVAQ